MRLISVQIENFKGIRKLALDFSKSPQSSVYTLIGLNESGKTTILEAIDSIRYRSEKVNLAGLPGFKPFNIKDAIPANERGDFTGSIVVAATFKLDESDQASLEAFLIGELGFRLTKRVETIKITDRYGFDKDEIDWEKSSMSLWVTFTGQRIGKKRAGKSKDEILEGEEWKTAARFLKDLVPGILYFPNFLIDFPKRVCLNDINPNMQTVYLNQIFGDVIASYNSSLSVETDLVERALSTSDRDKKSLNSLLAKISKHITENIFAAWYEIFQRKVDDKEVILHLEKEDDKVYFRFEIKDGTELFDLHERSLGFRWFFLFFLFTQFRSFRANASRHVIYLFDEPASNLHAAAQQKLLAGFKKLAKQSTIIYSTHSHHLVNPEWLEGAYIVRDQSLVYDDFDLGSRAENTNISATRYRDFVSSNPRQTVYYQPALESLQYKPSRLENVPNVVMVEGKNDFYTIKYFQYLVGREDLNVHLLPGGGAGSLDSVIQLYTAWGKRFIVLLDGDKEGRDQKGRYADKFGCIVEGATFTLADIESDWSGMSLEELISDKDKEMLRVRYASSVKNFSKQAMNRAFQEILMTGQKVPFSDVTMDKFIKVLVFLKEKLVAQSV